MKDIVIRGERAFDAEKKHVGEGNHSYTIEFNWAKWPVDKQGVHVLNGEFDTEGVLYAATDDPEIPIVKFSRNGEFLGSIGKGLFKKAHSVFLTKQNTILVADTGLNINVIREISLSGDLIRDFGHVGQPSDSGYDPDYYDVLVAENRVPKDEKWLKNAKQNARLDSIRRRGMNFCRPCNMIISTDGNYYAADGYGNAAVHRFNCDGSYHSSWGQPGNAPGEFRLVHDIHEDRKGRLWVSDRENRRIQIFDHDGGLIAIIHGNLMRTGASWANEHYIYVGELDGGISIFDYELNCVMQLGVPGSALHAHGITVDKEGNIFLFTNKKNYNNIVVLKNHSV